MCVVAGMLREGIVGKSNTTLATVITRGPMACVIQGSMKSPRLVFDWPNHSLTQALQAPPMAARHVVGGGENRWLECDPVSPEECWQPSGWEQWARQGDKHPQC